MLKTRNGISVEVHWVNSGKLY